MRAPFTRTINNPGDVEIAIREQQRQRLSEAQADVLIELPRRLILRSPNGTYWQVSVDNAGALHTTSLGATVP